jgi:hydrogenase nickel incorporation protein HypA/HybF
MGIAQTILEHALAAAQSNGIARIVKLQLKIGVFSGVVDDSLRFSFEVASQGTKAEGAVLVVDNVPLRVRCVDCGREKEIQPILFQCPLCGSRRVDIITGQELTLVSIEGE